MKCPLDQNTLVISERGGFEIDYCPECRGVWLDRGELDKLIDRAGAVSTGVGSGVGVSPGHPATPSPGSADQSRYEREHAEWQRDYGRREPGGYDQRQGGYDQRQGGYDERQGGYGPGGQRRKKKDNWLSELFD